MTSSYLLIGHLTLDRSATGTAAGGTVLYSGRLATALGYDTRILTSTSDDALALAKKQLQGAEIENLPSSESTIFEYSWKGTERIQKLAHVARHLGVPQVPSRWLQADVWHLAPVASEVDLAICRLIPSGHFLGITPQGWMRQTSSDHVVVPIDWRPPAELLDRANAIVFSRHDLPAAHERAMNWSRNGPVVAVTAAAEGSTIYSNGEGTHLPSYPVTPKSELGAGDIFATALFDRLDAGDNAVTAGRVASAAAALAVSRGVGPDHLPVPNRSEIERFMRLHGHREEID